RGSQHSSWKYGTRGGWPHAFACDCRQWGEGDTRTICVPNKVIAGENQNEGNWFDGETRTTKLPYRNFHICTNELHRASGGPAALGLNRNVYVQCLRWSRPGAGYGRLGKMGVASVRVPDHGSRRTATGRGAN